MGAAQHTPGPWSAIPQADGSRMIVRECETGNQVWPRGILIVTNVIARKDSPVENEANARLIAAAPELLNAPKAALAILMSADNDLPQIAARRALAIAAIAKATGSAP